MLHGLRAIPDLRFCVAVIKPNSGALVRHVRVKPARSNALTTGTLCGDFTPGAADDP
jgi:hypothetical protein